LPGLDLAAAGASGTQIANALVGLDSTQLAAGIPGGQAVGFFAQSYTLNGQKIISYRGTDNPGLLANANGAGQTAPGHLRMGCGAHTV
jgi:hypothetical protein